MKKISWTVLALFFAVYSYGQTKKVLFIGNSYTGVNNLPQLVKNAAASVGDELIFDKHTPGGAQLVNHAFNATAISKINSNDWDHVVLQAQSQEPSFPDGQVASQVYPYATILCDSIRANSACTRPMFYMTWGRENGDANNCPFWPPVCTYEGMDSLLNLRYRIMGADNEAYVSPVGAVWHYIRDHYPAIDLYTNDGSHPSQAGSYAAACTFYSMIFQKDPTLITFDYSLSVEDATIIKEAAKTIVFDDLETWNVGVYDDTYDPVADFSFVQEYASFDFTNLSTDSENYVWDFGDGNISTDENPSHTYQANGDYLVQLTASKCGFENTTTTTVNVQVVSNVNVHLEESAINIYPNPTDNIFTITGVIGSYQVKVLDEFGTTYQIWNGTNLLEIDINDLPTGLYFIHIERNGNPVCSARKILKME